MTSPVTPEIVELSTADDSAPVNRVMDFANQDRMFDPASFVEPVDIIGLGGINTAVLATIVPMGIGQYSKCRIWDDDVVMPHNIASQVIYKLPDLYRPKAEVCKQYLLAYGAKDVEIMPRRFTADDTARGLVISGVDSMESRKIIWNAIKARPDDVQLYLDGRIGALQTSLLAVEPYDGEWYENKWLFDDSKAMPLPCGQRAIVYPAVALSALVASHIVNWHSGKMPPKRVDFNLGDLTLTVVGKRR